MPSVLRELQQHIVADTVIKMMTATMIKKKRMWQRTHKNSSVSKFAQDRGLFSFHSEKYWSRDAGVVVVVGAGVAFSFMYFFNSSRIRSIGLLVVSTSGKVTEKIIKTNQ